MYRRELSGSPYYDYFIKASRLFDYHIYGGFKAEYAEYEKIKALFEHLNPLASEVSKS